MDDTQTVDNAVTGHSSPVIQGKPRHPGGRPTKYNKEVCELARNYLVDWKDYDAIPSIVGLCNYTRINGLSISRDTVHTWVQEEGKKEFSDIIKQLLAEQERSLLNNGLTKAFDSGMAKLVLSKHGYTDKIEHDNKIAITVHRVDYKQETGITIQHDDRPALPGTD